MQLNSKQKSNIIFWVIFTGFIAFLYLTPWGESTRSWLSSLTLTSPDIEESTVKDSNEKTLSTDWNLQSTNYEEIWLSDFDKPIFINIWATWCPPCKAELPSIIKLADKYHDQVVFLLISPDESIETLINFSNKYDYQIPFYNEISATPYNLQTGSYPTTFILNKKKEVTHKMVGSHDWNTEKVYSLLDKLIGE